MNEVEIVEGWRYKMQDLWWIGSEFTKEIYVIKIVKIKHWFKFVEWIVYSEFEDLDFESIMTLEKFKSKVLYKVNK